MAPGPALAPLSRAASAEADRRRRGFAPARQRALPTPVRMAMRRHLIGVAKRLLPLASLALLASIALWPEVHRWTERARLAGARFSAEQLTGVMTSARYDGVDERGRPYTVTAVQARQVSPVRVDLTQPKGDVSLEGGRWLLALSQRGVYVQHLGSLDMSGEVEIYRDDGTVLQTDTATLDLKNGSAGGADRVHAEGPFGTLDAQGFSMTDRGSQLQFWGPGRLVLNAAHR
jgi:lipopolysaccharide export system protein LptC